MINQVHDLFNIKEITKLTGGSHEFVSVFKEKGEEFRVIIELKRIENRYSMFDGKKFDDKYIVIITGKQMMLPGLIVGGKVEDALRAVLRCLKLKTIDELVKMKIEIEQVSQGKKISDQKKTLSPDMESKYNEKRDALIKQVAAEEEKLMVKTTVEELKKYKAKLLIERGIPSMIEEEISCVTSSRKELLELCYYTDLKIGTTSSLGTLYSKLFASGEASEQENFDKRKFKAILTRCKKEGSNIYFLLFQRFCQFNFGEKAKLCVIEEGTSFTQGIIYAYLMKYWIEEGYKLGDKVEDSILPGLLKHGLEKTIKTVKRDYISRIEAVVDWFKYYPHDIFRPDKRFKTLLLELGIKFVSNRKLGDSVVSFINNI